jgi:aspartate/tyrosine/aromatic aminotransferase
MAKQPVIPVLSINTDQITKRDDQLAYLLRHAFYNPGWTSSQIESSLVSMRRLLAQYEDDPAEFANALKQRLEAAVQRLYAYCRVNVTTYNISPTQ